MRRNFFGDAYCHTTEEVINELVDEDVDQDDVYLAEINEPEDGETMYCGEVCDNSAGDTVLYIEALTADAVRDMARAAGIDIQA